MDNKLKEAAIAFSCGVGSHMITPDAVRAFEAGAAYERERQAKRVCGECKYLDMESSIACCNPEIARQMPEGEFLAPDKTFGCKLWEGK